MVWSAGKHIWKIRDGDRDRGKLEKKSLESNISETIIVRILTSWI